MTCYQPSSDEVTGAGRMVKTCGRGASMAIIRVKGGPVASVPFWPTCPYLSSAVRAHLESPYVVRRLSRLLLYFSQVPSYEQ